MKKLIFLMLPLFGFSQQTIKLDLGKDLKDATHTVKNVSVIDNRTDKSAPVYNFKGENYVFQLPDDMNAAMREEFDKDNKTKGTREIVVMLEDFNVFENNTGKKIVPAAHVRASAFEKKNDQFYYLYTMDKNLGTLDMQSTMSPKLIAGYFHWDFSDFLKTSFAKQSNPTSLSQDQLYNYYTILSSTMPAFTQPIQDGVYETYESFFNQRFAEGFTLERNKDGKITRAKKGDQKIPAHKIFAFVEDGKIYKNTYSGFLPVEKNDKGFYVFSNRGELEIIPADSTLGMFGLVGGIAAAAQQNSKQDKAKKADKKEIYIDPLTGAFIF